MYAHERIMCEQNVDNKGVHLAFVFRALYIYPYSSGLPHWHWDSYDWPGAREVTLKDIGKTDPASQRTTTKRIIPRKCCISGIPHGTREVTWFPSSSEVTLEGKQWSVKQSMRIVLVMDCLCATEMRKRLFNDIKIADMELTKFHDMIRMLYYGSVPLPL